MQSFWNLFIFTDALHVSGGSSAHHQGACGLCFAKVTILVSVNLLKPIGYVMHQQFNIQQLYALPTLYLCVLYLSENASPSGRAV